MGTAASEDLEHDGTWPRFGPSAAALGAHAVFSVGLFPLSVGRRDPVRGALNLYRTSPGGFDRTDREIALMLAAHASTALAYASATAAARRREAQFETALVSRDVIGQAKGILMERRGLEPDDAFAVLRRASQDLNIKLRDVADLLVRRRTEL